MAAEVAVHQLDVQPPRHEHADLIASKVSHPGRPDRCELAHAPCMKLETQLHRYTRKRLKLKRLKLDRRRP